MDEWWDRYVHLWIQRSAKNERVDNALGTGLYHLNQSIHILIQIHMQIQIQLQFYIQMQIHLQI